MDKYEKFKQKLADAIIFVKDNALGDDGEYIEEYFRGIAEGLDKAKRICEEIDLE